MSKEAMKLALEALDIVKIHFTQNRYVNEAITALREALAEQPAQQEPVAWVCYGAPGKRDIDFEEADINRLPIGTQLYTSPPAQRPWVGLTDEEIDYQAKKDDHAIYFALGALWAEAKLKEKNNG